jgi:hypothetical protein
MMPKKNWLLTIAVLAVLLVATQRGQAEIPTPNDSLCPAARPYVAKYVEQTANSNTPVADIVATMNEAISNFDRCAGSHDLGSSAIRRQYAQVRSAQFHVSLGRLQRLLGENDSARTQFEIAIGLLKETIGWRDLPDATRDGASPARGDAVGWVKSSPETSQYRDVAIVVRDAALAELDKLPKAASLP